MKGKHVSYFTICLPEKSLSLVVEFLVLRNTKLTVFIPISMFLILFVEMERLHLFLEEVVYCEVHELNIEIENIHIYVNYL